MRKKCAIETNITAAKLAVQEMIKHWSQWKKASKKNVKLQCIAGYAAAFTSCKVYIENYLKHLYPDENKIPLRVAKDIRNLVSDIDAIEKVSNKVLQKAIHDIDQLNKDAA